MKGLSSLLETRYSCEELQKLASILDKKYNSSYFFRGWDVLDKYVFRPINYDIRILKSKYDFKDVFNMIIMSYGKNEKVVKYFLSKEFIENKDEVCLFEYNVCNSRVDFARINGKSHAYEIKTELDNLDRLNQQISDYKKVFEFVTVVAHKNHVPKVRKVISRNVGIISYEFNDNSIEFNEVRKAKQNKGFYKNAQLNNLTSEELKIIIVNYLNMKSPQYRNQRENIIKRKLVKNDLNEAFKFALKISKNRKWEHIKNNFDMLKPIEIQSCYNNV